MLSSNRLLSRLSLLALLAPSVLADVQFMQPAPGSQYRASGVPQVTWKDSGKAPALADLTNYVLNLCAGGNTKGSYMCPLAVLKTDGVFAGTDTAVGLTPISPAVGATSENGYFLQMESITADGGKVYNYSPRFGLSGMRGSFTPEVEAGIKAVGSSTQGPPSSKEDADEADTTQTVAPDGAYGVPYNQQQGTIRYAPMQPQPPTSISAANPTPLWPTSSVPIAKTILGSPNVATTMTQSQTHSVHSIENPASPVPGPQEHMARWLERWRD